MTQYISPCLICLVLHGDQSIWDFARPGICSWCQVLIIHISNDEVFFPLFHSSNVFTVITLYLSRSRYLKMISSIPARQRLFHVTRRGPSFPSYRLNTSLASTWADQKRTGGSRFKNNKLVYAAGGTAVAAVGLLYTRSGGYDGPEDPRDRKTLSTVPLTKLVSGWM